MPPKMDTIEVAQTLLGLSKAEESKWDGEKEGDDEESSSQSGAVTASPSGSECDTAKEKTTKGKTSNPSKKRKGSNSTTTSRKNKRSGATKRTLNALNNFYVRADELKAFRRQHGHCNVPQTFPDNQPLANWVARMRREKKKMEENQQSMLNQSMVEHLEKVGFEWGQRRGDELWNTRYTQLRDFYMVHKHTRVPTKAKVLGRWVSTQRDEWRKLKMGMPSSLTKTKIDMLCEIEFCWDCHMELDPRKYPEKKSKSSSASAAIKESAAATVIKNSDASEKVEPEVEVKIETEDV